jgi:hypothetical protein
MEACVFLLLLFYFTAAALLNVAMGELDGEEGGGGSGAHPVTAMRVALGKSSHWVWQQELSSS